MTEVSQQNLDWRKDITTKDNTIKVSDGGSVTGVFMDEGVYKKSDKFGDSIVFQFHALNDDKVKNFYVGVNNHSFLSEIKQLGKLTGLKVTISRIGSKKYDTRYYIKKAE